MKFNRQLSQTIALTLFLLVLSTVTYMYLERRSPNSDTEPSKGNVIAETADPVATIRTLDENTQAPPTSNGRHVVRQDNLADRYRNLLDMALSGDADSQYEVYKILKKCYVYADSYLKNGFELDDWLLLFNDYNDEVRFKTETEYKECSGFLTKDEYEFEAIFGSDSRNFVDWLYMAADSGNAAASVRYAVIQVVEQGNEDRERIDLLLETAIGGNTGEADTFISRIYEGWDDINYAAWGILACANEVDCAEGSDWHKELCLKESGCVPGETVLDIIREEVGTWSFDKAVERAEEIESMRSQNRIQDIGLSYNTIKTAVARSN